MLRPQSIIPHERIVLSRELARSGRAAGAQRALVNELARQARLGYPLAAVSVRPHPNGEKDQYELLTGAPRWEAAIKAELPHMPVEICDEPEMHAAIETLINVSRERRRNPMTVANTLQTLVGTIHAVHQELAELIGWSRNTVTAYLLLLELPEEIQALLNRGRLSFGHGKALCSPLIADNTDRQIELAGEAVRGKWSVRQLEEKISGRPASSRKASHATEADEEEDNSPIIDTPDIRKQAEDLREAIGQNVVLRHRESGKGKLIISYNTLDELEGVTARLFQRPPAPQPSTSWD